MEMWTTLKETHSTLHSCSPLTFHLSSLHSHHHFHSLPPKKVQLQI